jgi:hypothetical protein
LPKKGETAMTEQGEGREEGAEREQHGHQEGLEPDPLAERLTPDGAVMLVGILGEGPTEDDRYLFLNRELTRRAEFKASDVLHSEKIREEDPPFLGAQATRVYLRRGARVVYTTTQSREMQAEFLRGDIGAGVTAEAGLAGPPGAEEFPLIDPTFLGAPCPSRYNFGCGVSFRNSPWGCSAVDACPSFSPWACGSAVDACPSALGCSRIFCAPR